MTGLMLLALTLIGWASSPLFLKYFVNFIDAWTSNGWRYAIAALFWLPVLLRTRGNRDSLARGRLVVAERTPRAGANIAAADSPDAGLWRAAIWPSVFNVLGQVAFAWVLYLDIDPGLLTFLLRVQIVSVTIGAFVLFPDERALLRTGGYWSGTLLVIVGSFGAIFLGQERPAGASAWGILSGVVSGALFGCYAVAVRKCMRPYSSMKSFAAISVYTSAALIVLMLLFGERAGGRAFDLSSWQWVMLVISALAGIALGHVFYYASIARLGVSVASGVLLLQPFMTAAASWLFFDEQLTAAQWIAGSVGVAGAGIVLRVQNRLRSRAMEAVLQAEPRRSAEPCEPPASDSGELRTAGAGSSR